METQKKYSFDLITLKKIGIGAILSFLGASAVFLLDYFGKVEISDPLLASYVSFIAPFLANAARQFVRGN